MKILITGAQGMLGSALYHQCCLSNLCAIPLGKKEADITKSTQLRQVIQRYHPTHIINTAAYTNVDRAETEKEIVFAVNALGAKNIANIAREQNIKLLHISTDYVFDGKQVAPYREESPVQPLSVYGQTKAEGERWVLQLNPASQIVRVQALYGENGSHFVQTMLRLSKAGKPIRVVQDQLTTPSYTQHVAAGILRLLMTPASGIFHLRNQGFCSWYEFAREIFAHQEKIPILIPISSKNFHTPAPRPLNSQLSMARWEQLKIPPLPHWKQALREFLDGSG